MPQSRNRAGHHHYQKPSAIPAGQRTKGRIVWAILFAIFAGLIALFAAGESYVALLIGVIIGAVVGYFVGKNMERDAKE